MIDYVNPRYYNHVDELDETKQLNSYRSGLQTEAQLFKIIQNTTHSESPSSPIYSQLWKIYYFNPESYSKIRVVIHNLDLSTFKSIFKVSKKKNTGSSTNIYLFVYQV